MGLPTALTALSERALPSGLSLTDATLSPLMMKAFILKRNTNHRITTDMEKLFPHGELLETVKCPVCGASVEINNGSLLCKGARRHCFDFASSGYVNLSPSGKSESGDSKSAVGARRRFLSLGYYFPAARALADAFLIQFGAG